MISFDDILFFDTETTGVIPRGAQWDANYSDFPYIVQISWMKGKKIESHIIRPDGWEIPNAVSEIHGITNEIAIRDGEPFADVVWRFITDCIGSELICGHNIHFDTSVIKANILRDFGWPYYDEYGVEDALFKGKRVDTMLSSVKWVDARFANGRLKFPRLEELYSRCFPGETFPSHDALEDVKAVARCLPVLVEKGFVELKLKEYPNEDLFHTQERPKNGPNSADNVKVDNLPIQDEKRGEIAFFEKITEYDVELNFFE